MDSLKKFIPKAFDKEMLSYEVEFESARGHIFQRSTWPAPLSDACADFWTWDKWDCSPEVCLYADQVQDGDQGGDGVHHAEALKTAHFHPTWSNGTAGVRGTRVLNHGVHYWEVQLSQRVFGTSMMVGVGTRRARLHLDAFTNLLGEDAAGWGFSHKGLLWHDGSWRQYAKPFRENAPATVGVLFDGRHGQGTVTFFKDGVCLGVAFEGLNEVKEELFPVVCSTAAKTEMRLGRTLRGFDSLQDRCRAVIAQHCQNNELEMLPLPTRIKGYIQEVMS